jgi:hypothetical protein
MTETLPADSPVISELRLLWRTYYSDQPERAGEALLAVAPLLEARAKLGHAILEQQRLRGEVLELEEQFGLR